VQRVAIVERVDAQASIRFNDIRKAVSAQNVTVLRSGNAYKHNALFG
jgi:hypothetical protein